MLNRFILFHIVAFWAVNLSAVEKINFDGSRYKISANNEINLTKSISHNKWHNASDFVKLSFTEYTQNTQQVKRQIALQAEASKNQFPLTEFSGFHSGDDLLLFKTLVADTEFLRLLKFVGDQTSCVVMDFSMPLNNADSLQKSLTSMLNSLTWQSGNLLILNETPLIQLVKPAGFRVTHKYVNSVVLHSTTDNPYELDANLVLSIVHEDVAESDLLDTTRQLLSKSQALENLEILELADVDSMQGAMVKAKASGRYEASQIDIDISHITLKLGDLLLITQLTTPKNLESFLKLEDVIMQVLSNLKYQKQT